MKNNTIPSLSTLSRQQKNNDSSTSSLSTVNQQNEDSHEISTENIQVFLRMRPPSKREKESQESDIWVLGKNSIRLNMEQFNNLARHHKIHSAPNAKMMFFNGCFSQNITNAMIYQNIVSRIVISSLAGINGTVFMYGQTGAGKTYTMMGDYSLEKNENDLSSIGDSTSMSLLSNRTPTRRSMATLSKSKPTDRNKTPLARRGSRNLNNSSICSALTQRKPETEEKGTNILNEGVLILALKELFEKIASESNTSYNKAYFVRCSCFEIYNDQIYDLLTTVDRIADPMNLSEDPKNHEFYIKNLIEYDISSVADALNKLRIAESNRHYAITSMNHHSSRSHTIFRLKIVSIQKDPRLVNLTPTEESKQFIASNDSNACEISLFPNKDPSMANMENSNDSNSIITEACLNFVDLAGSEKVSNHNNLTAELMRDSSPIDSSANPSLTMEKHRNDRVKEGKSINRSLFYLTQVISMKAEGKCEHIPYRNSPLTKILKSSLGGNSRTLILLCCTPMHSQYEQTMSTLRFGTSAKKIENKVFANVTTHTSEEAYQLLISQYEERLKEVEEQRVNDKNRVEYMMKMICELQRQKDKLNKKLMKANEKSIGGISIISKHIPSDALSSDIGIIFSSSQICHNEASFISSHFTLDAFKKIKLEKSLLEDKQKVLINYLQEAETTINTELQKEDDLMEKYTSLKKQYNKDKLEKRKIAEYSKKLSSRLFLIENLDGITSCSDLELDRLEKQMLDHLGKIKAEKARRKNEEKMMMMKSKIMTLTKLNRDLMARLLNEQKHKKNTSLAIENPSVKAEVVPSITDTKATEAENNEEENKNTNNLSTTQLQQQVIELQEEITTQLLNSPSKEDGKKERQNVSGSNVCNGEIPSPGKSGIYKLVNEGEEYEKVVTIMESIKPAPVISAAGTSESSPEVEFNRTRKYLQRRCNLMEKTRDALSRIDKSVGEIRELINKKPIVKENPSTGLRKKSIEKKLMINNSPQTNYYSVQVRTPENKEDESSKIVHPSKQPQSIPSQPPDSLHHSRNNPSEDPSISLVISQSFSSPPSELSLIPENKQHFVASNRSAKSKQGNNNNKKLVELMEEESCESCDGPARKVEDDKENLDARDTKKVQPGNKSQLSELVKQIVLEKRENSRGRSGGAKMRYGGGDENNTLMTEDMMAKDDDEANENN